MTKDNLKARLAYSTVSQLSYIVLGAMLANETGLLGGSLHIVMHAFAKITLFFAAGAILVTTHKTEISDMAGMGRAMPLTFGAFSDCQSEPNRYASVWRHVEQVVSRHWALLKPDRWACWPCC